MNYLTTEGKSIFIVSPKSTKKYGIDITISVLSYRGARFVSRSNYKGKRVFLYREPWQFNGLIVFAFQPDSGLHLAFNGRKIYD